MAATVNSNASSALSPRASAGEAGGPRAPPRRESPPPWNQIPPCNAALESGVVMEDASWPSLSESAKASSNPSDPPISQASPPSPQKKTNIKPNKPNLNPNFKRLGSQKAMSHNNGGSSSSDGGLSQLISTGDYALHGSNSSSKMNSGGSDSSGKDHKQNNANREGAQSSYGRSNSGSFGGRRNHDRRENDWSHRRSFNGRDSVMPAPNGYIRPHPPHPLGATPYFPPPPPPPLPYGGLMGIPHEMQQLYYYPPPPPGMPVLAPMPPSAYYPPPMDHHLRVKIINQIDYYFSNDNLIKDTYLRKNMDEYGWVPIQLIANFRKVMELTTDIQLILDALRTSTTVEVLGDKIRRRDDWMRWIMPSSAQFATTSSTLLPTHLQGLTLQEKQS